MGFGASKPQQRVVVVQQQPQPVVYQQPAQPKPPVPQPQQPVPQQQPPPQPPPPSAQASAPPAVSGPTTSAPAPTVTWEQPEAPVVDQETLDAESERRAQENEETHKKDRKKSRAEAAASGSKITEETLREFIANQAEIEELEGQRVDEKFQLLSIEQTTLSEAYDKQLTRLEELKAITAKEYKDVAEFNVQQYMSDRGVSFMADEEIDAIKAKEESEYIEAAGTQEVAEKELANLEVQKMEQARQLEDARLQSERLVALRLKMDGLLENIFNNSYGSDLEDRLELEVEQMMQYKKHVSLAHFKWWNGRKLIFNACSQMAQACRTWTKIGQLPNADQATRWALATEVRNNMIAAHQNSQRAIEYLKMQLPYWTYNEDKNMINSINVLLNDLCYVASYQKALAWYKYYHWKLALQLNWMDQTINNKIVVDYKRVSHDYQVKYRELRLERLRLIKEKAKEFLDIEMNLDELIAKHGDASIPDDEDDEVLQAMESSIGIMPDMSEMETGDPTEGVDYENREGAGSQGPPLIKLIPLDELAPPPSNDDLFGNVAELQSQHKKQLDDFEKEQETNKMKMDANLQEKLRARKSQRRRKEMQQAQESALGSTAAAS